MQIRSTGASAMYRQLRYVHGRRFGGLGLVTSGQDHEIRAAGSNKPMLTTLSRVVSKPTAWGATITASADPIGRFSTRRV
ncbi:hypothetical protein J6590_012547 [Homalodisca vitripennis]|nr:hypothetical protein J6590_012547 [Homalodisca vitripennis]